MEKELQPKICQISLTGSTAPTLPEILPRAEAVSVCPLCEKIIEDHGGRIWATSKEGIGTEVHFVLRKYQEVVQE